MLIEVRLTKVAFSRSRSAKPWEFAKGDDAEASDMAIRELGTELTVPRLSRKFAVRVELRLRVVLSDRNTLFWKNVPGLRRR